jgi:hypothetical protein
LSFASFRVTLQRFGKAFPEIPPILLLSKGGELFGNSLEDSTLPLLEKRDEGSLYGR